MRSGFIVVGARGNIGSHILSHLRALGHSALGVDLPEGVSPSDGLIECDFRESDEVGLLFDEVPNLLSEPKLVLVLALGKIHNEPLLSVGAGELKTHQKQTWDQVIESNLTTLFIGTREFARLCWNLRKPGLVIAFSSISARGNPGQAAYSSAKAGVEGFVRAAAKELGPLGIRTAAIAPGYMSTNSTRTKVSETRLEKLRAATPLRRLGGEEDLAGTVIWLAETEFLTGETIHIDGWLVI